MENTWALATFNHKEIYWEDLKADERLVLENRWEEGRPVKAAGITESQRARTIWSAGYC